LGVEQPLKRQELVTMNENARHTGRNRFSAIPDARTV